MNPLLVVFHGSSLWALISKDAERIYKTWNLTVRNVFCLARTIYRRLIEPVSSCFHIKTSLISRYIKFVNTLMESRKFSVRYLARIMAGNVNSLMGRLLTFIGDELNLAISQINEVFPKVIKRALGMLILNQERSGKYFLIRASTSKGLSIPMFTYSRIWWWWNQRLAKLNLHFIRYIGTNLYHLIMSM